MMFVDSFEATSTLLMLFNKPTNKEHSPALQMISVHVAIVFTVYVSQQIYVTVVVNGIKMLKQVRTMISYNVIEWFYSNINLGLIIIVILSVVIL